MSTNRRQQLRSHNPNNNQIVHKIICMSRRRLRPFIALWRTHRGNFKRMILLRSPPLQLRRLPRVGTRHQYNTRQYHRMWLRELEIHP